MVCAGEVRAGTPADILNKLNLEVVKALKTPELQERLSSLGAEPMGTAQKETAVFIKAQMKKCATPSGCRARNPT